MKMSFDTWLRAKTLRQTGYKVTSSREREISLCDKGVLMRNLAKRLDQMDLHPRRLGFRLPEVNSMNQL